MKTSYQTLVSVSKRSFKRAVDRNRIKRLIKNLAGENHAPPSKNTKNNAPSFSFMSVRSTYFRRSASKHATLIA